MEMQLNSIKDAFDRVTKKQKLACSKTQEVIDQIAQEIEKALETINSASTDHNAVLAELKKKFQETAPLSQLEGSQKELNVALSKYVKALEKVFVPDITKAYRNIDFDSSTLNQIIASHFYRLGLFDVGDCFVKEAGEQDAAVATRSLFQEMYDILKAMKQRNLEPALNWAATNSDKLKENGSDIHLKLHQLQFGEILQKRGQGEAINYARTHISPFSDNHMVEIQKLMVCLLWADKLEDSRYGQLLSASYWETVEAELTRQCCNLLGQSYQSPLSVTIAAGVQALPFLLKFMNVVEKRKWDYQAMKQLPMQMELDKEFQFHSIFVCPILKEQSTDENPPILLPCGHVLCKQSINKMSKNNTKSFKCPYCPLEMDTNQCKQLYF